MQFQSCLWKHEIPSATFLMALTFEKVPRNDDPKTLKNLHVLGIGRLSWVNNLPFSMVRNTRFRVEWIESLDEVGI
jgi:hypothetical protein